MARKYYKAVRAKPGKLITRWGRFPEDMEAGPELISAGNIPDVHWLLTVAFSSLFERELVARGYDITTLKFSVERAK